MWQKRFDTSYVGFMKDGAQWLKDNTDIKLVGKAHNYEISKISATTLSWLGIT